MEPTSRRIRLGTGLSYHLLEWGADRPELDHTVVLLHGFLDLAWGWAACARAGLAGRFHLVAPDFRGHGDSDPVGPGGYYHFMDYLADLSDVIRQVGRARVSLVGHSMGGSVAAYYAGSFPEAIHRMALLEGMGPPEAPDRLPDRVRTWIASWRALAARDARLYRTVDEAAVRLRAVDPLLDADLARELAEHGTCAQPDGRRRFKHDPLHITTGPTPFRVDLAAEFWRRIRCPILVVEGERSQFRYHGEEQARRLALFGDPEDSTIAKAVVAVVPGAGHMMQRHQPAALAELLVRFLA